MTRATRGKIEERLAVIERTRNVRPVRPGLTVTVDSADANTQAELAALVDAKVTAALAERPGHYDPDISIARVIVYPPDYGPAGEPLNAGWGIRWGTGDARPETINKYR